MEKKIGNFSAIHLGKRRVQVVLGKHNIQEQTTSNLRNHGNGSHGKCKGKDWKFWKQNISAI